MDEFRRIPGQTVSLNQFFEAVVHYILSFKNSTLYALIADAAPILLTISIFATLIFVILSIIIWFKIEEIDHAQHEELERLARPPEPKQISNKKWDRVIQHITSNNENDWRLAILEADILLDEMLDGLGVHGQTIGEKLKSLTKEQFPYLQKAWDAHLIRNRIAHEGQNYQLSHREAQTAIGLFEQVLRAGLYLK